MVPLCCKGPTVRGVGRAISSHRAVPFGFAGHLPAVGRTFRPHGRSGAVLNLLPRLFLAVLVQEAESQPQTIGQAWHFPVSASQRLSAGLHEAKLEEVTRRLESLEITSSRKAGSMPSDSWRRLATAGDSKECLKCL